MSAVGSHHGAQNEPNAIYNEGTQARVALGSVHGARILENVPNAPYGAVLHLHAVDP